MLDVRGTPLGGSLSLSAMCLVFLGVWFVRKRNPFWGFLSSLTFAISDIRHRGMELGVVNGGLIYVRVFWS